MAAAAAAAAAALVALPVVQRLSTSVVRVLGLNPGPFTLQGTNTYLVGTGRRRILIDTGEGIAGYTDKLHQALALTTEEIEPTSDTAAVKPPSFISDIIITHWHKDHVGGTGDVRALHSRLDTSISEQLTIRKFPSLEKDEEKFEELKDGDTISVEGATLSVVHTPGHTGDHVALYLKEESALFSGDCVLGSGTAVFENLKTYMESLRKILDLKPKLIYPGHGPVVSDPVHVLQHYISHREQRESEILLALKDVGQGLTIPEIVGLVYKNIDPSVFRGACGNVWHHLEKLKAEAKVICHESGSLETHTWSLTQNKI